MSTLNFLGIIPARYASTRFPGKPLVDIGGKSMIQRVYEQSSKAFDCVYVATDDERISAAVSKFGGKVVMTSEHHRSGTDRCVEALEKIIGLEKKPFDVVINIQGDEPFVDPSQLQMLMLSFENSDTHIATLVKQISSNEDIFNPNLPKVVFTNQKQALYFSRSPIPYVRNYPQNEWHLKHIYYKHLGIYAYRSEVLKELAKLSPSSLELAESLEQNRWLENGYKIGINITTHETLAVDTPEDLEKIKQKFGW
jgi:3-deoxy-manno-octulosonate cytidylyltransferase (CMP-KDO synthetase)